MSYIIINVSCQEYIQMSKFSFISYRFKTVTYHYFSLFLFFTLFTKIPVLNTNPSKSNDSPNSSFNSFLLLQVFPEGVVIIQFENKLQQRCLYQRLAREKRERQDQSETSIRLERYGDMEDGLSQSNKIAGKIQRERELETIYIQRELDIARELQRPRETQ